MEYAVHDWFFPAINSLLNICMIGLLIVAIRKFIKMINDNANRQQQFVEVFLRMDKASRENAIGLDEQIVTRTNDLNSRLNYLTRWQKITAKMIRDQHQFHVNTKEKG